MEKLKTKNPFTGSVIKEYEFESLDQVQRKMDRALQAQKSWAKKPLRDRITLVEGALKYFEENKDTVAKDTSEQMGRPLTQIRGEISGLLDRGRYMCKIAEKTLSPEVIEDSEVFYRAIEHTPLGVIFVISAWNYPLLITINSVVPGLLAGNTILLKHSSLTPEIGFHFEKAFSQLSDTQDLLQSLVINHKTTGEVIENLPINHVIFTGSVSGGKKILEHSSKKFITPQLELGGKDAAYLDEDLAPGKELDQAIASIVDGAMFNSGQSCCGIERAYVHEKHYLEFVEKAKSLIGDYALGDPLDKKTSLGPQANPKSIDLMLSQIEQAKSQGAEVICGGKDVFVGSARFMQPTLLVDVDQSMEVLQEENFGPILPVKKVKDMDEAIDCINDSKYGLTASIFTKNFEKAQRFSSGVHTGTVFLNRCDYLDPALPWTGIKDSGCGSSLSKYGFYGVTRRKSIHFKR